VAAAILGRKLAGASPNGALLILEAVFSPASSDRFQHILIESAIYAPNAK